jgi:hypothetical protein
MPLFNLSVKHGRTVDEARRLLELAVKEAQGRFGPLIQRVDWSADRSSVKLFGVGFEAQMRVDALDVHVSGDMPLLGNLLSGPLVSGFKAIIQQTFQKRLT